MSHLLPIPSLGVGLEVKRGVVFAKLDVSTLKMDIYKRRGVTTGAPVFMYIHGGGWVTGTRLFASLPLLCQVCGLLGLQQLQSLLRFLLPLLFLLRLMHLPCCCYNWCCCCRVDEVSFPSLWL
jgi:hypothetical protein